MLSDQVYSVPSDDSSEDEIDPKDPIEQKKKAIRLAHALSVLAIKPSTFDYLQKSSKFDGVATFWPLFDTFHQKSFISASETVRRLTKRESGHIPSPESRSDSGRIFKGQKRPEKRLCALC